MRTWSARIRSLSKEEGGRWSAAGDGVHSQLGLGAMQTSCRVWMSEQLGPVFATDCDSDVEIEPMFWDVASKAFDPDAPVVLSEGNRVVARGEWIR